ncbi:hypothetical protein C1Y40_04454 [Mycobacterium talmoniae]|uniref:CHK kinase-like domain-containing protein n=2 Tax=Mycobacterium talmoniae TaxID=1858794 RepID=A0A1S1NMQ5_9MYCO|nr:hypothetical protein BKN37_05800 [Mycobacterium talmoniae]PQM45418.1 hypothetical protein C1Y40_04454 [Mycobacterium talmoniae]
MSGAVDSRLSALEPAWCQKMLRSHGFGSVVLTTVHAEAMSVSGAVADMARLRLGYDPRHPSGPSSVIAKISAREGVRLALDQALGMQEREIRFYAEHADQVRLRSPRCVGVGDGTSTPLLLEDLGGLRAGDQAAGLAKEDADRLMDVLAEQHAAFWESPMCEESWLASPTDEAYASMVAQVVNTGVDVLADRYADRAPVEAIKAVEALAPRWRQVIDACAAGPRTVVHNDCRLDNIFFDDDGTPIFVDWQSVGVSRGIHDVANLLAGSMNIEELRQHWESLLSRYHRRLCALGVTDYGWQQCVAHYRQSILFPLGQGIALVGALNRHDGRGLTDPALLRPLLHCHDLNAFDTIDQHPRTMETSC